MISNANSSSSYIPQYHVKKKKVGILVDLGLGTILIIKVGTYTICSFVNMLNLKNINIISVILII